MGVSSISRGLLFFLGVTFVVCSGFIPENCTQKTNRIHTVYSVPGDVALLDSNLEKLMTSGNTSDPYNITWYDSNTGQQIRDQNSRILVRGEILWFLNTTLDDQGEYVAILRTPSRCDMTTLKLAVDLQVDGECGRPKVITQPITEKLSGELSCPLNDYIKELDRHNINFSIQWYKGCDHIEDGKGGYTYRRKDGLIIQMVDSKNYSNYTCTLTFTLGGYKGSVSETIEAQVTAKYSKVPQLQHPKNETIKAQMGSYFSKWCRVFVPGKGDPSVGLYWYSGGQPIRHDTSNNIYAPKKRKVKIPDVSDEGVGYERLLVISELREENLHKNYTCIVVTDKGRQSGYFTLLSADPNFLPIFGLVPVGLTVLFIISVAIYNCFKVDIVLWFRRVFPVFYLNKDLDGKLYDAYVAYPQCCDIGFSNEVEEFALNTLPQVLEKSCGYRLFIAGRDCLPGMAIVDSVEENLQASRCVLLLYTASTFISEKKISSHINNNPSSSDCREKNETTDNEKSRSNDEVSLDARQQLECVSVMHKALMEGSLKVILVELEEISPAQLALFPESVRQLRKKQGAVSWWKNKRKRKRSVTCMRRTEDEEKGGQDTKSSVSLSPSSRFWKKMRYHMPVNGKREPKKRPH